MRPGPYNEASDPFFGIDISGYARGPGGYEPNEPYAGVDIEAAARGHRPMHRDRAAPFAIQRETVGGFITVQNHDNYQTLHEAAAEAYDRFLNDGVFRRVVHLRTRTVAWPYKDAGKWA